jgi:hypothetical protein
MIAHTFESRLRTGLMIRARRLVSTAVRAVVTHLVTRLLASHATSDGRNP